MSISPDHFLLICETCEGPDRADSLRAALASKLPSSFDVRSISCMAGCGRPTTVGFQALDKAQYLFGDIQSAEDLDALAEFAHQYHRSGDGWTNATQRPPALLEKTLARLPRLKLETSA
ncbi:DUF1636 family protein [Ruegeria atlantica]|uniref:Putative metal-binding protein n=1 Tax=Ruegeria atlantica TaxID=81569 RepID=A0A0N7LNA7_9RHOB|nr:DUF1636 family protein [Ruegeria atlantica]CUH41892.1 putative metal-binding protein [Ruegeria atlantica]